MINQRSTLMILHIPKAAGTTLRWIMDRQYDQKRIYKIKGDIRGNQEKLAQMSIIGKRRLRAVFGHFCYGLYRALAPHQPYVHITVLRDPVQRIVSLYTYTRSESPGHYLHKAAREMSMYDFVTSGVTRYSENGMVRQLCGGDKFTMKQGKQVPYDDMAIPFRGVTRTHQDRAVDNLEQFAIVGFADQFPRMLAKMRATFAWRIPKYENKNVTRKRMEPDARTIAAIRELNELDYELYEWAKERFA